eukprot:comp20842_c0_seq1/m.27546 comp20842_c0_seq1/g.27546  ORF comp20842_c0_seq1/g.27546 comp20842_c0_seq1/m.27546 type:complete len:354 (-) comp20842_c0_seq1:421-1482(-)
MASCKNSMRGIALALPLFASLTAAVPIPQPAGTQEAAALIPTTTFAATTQAAATQPATTWAATTTYADFNSVETAPASPRDDLPKGPLLIRSQSSGKCLVTDGTAWPILGDCESNTVLQIYVNGSHLHTKDGRCMVYDNLFGEPGSDARVYVIDCTYDTWSDDVKQFTLPLPDGQLRVDREDKCVEDFSSSPASEPLMFVDCKQDVPTQKWELVPLEANKCRTPGDVWTVQSSDWEEDSQAKLYPITFSWASLPDNVNPGDDFKVTMCLTSYPEDTPDGMVEQCVARSRWEGTSIEVPIDAETASCRRHFSVVYESACGKGKGTEEVFGCVGQSCKEVCNKKGSQPSPGFPTK